MDDPNAEVLEANWVFVEEVDIAEEALPSNAEQLESLKNDEPSVKNLKDKTEFCHSDNFHLEYDDCSNKGDSQNMESDVDSDGISIISNWSCSQGTPEIESLDDSSENKDIEGKLEPSRVDTADEFEEDNICNKHVELTFGPKAVEDRHDVTPEQIEEEYALENAEATLEGPGTSGVPVLVSAEERIMECEQDPNLDQLKLLNDPDQSTEDTTYKHTVGNQTSKIPLYIKKHFNVSGFLIGTVLIAVSSVFLGRYCTVTDQIQEELPTYQEKVFLYDLPSDENFDVPTALSFCREKHKADNIYTEVNAQKCLNKIEKRMKRKKEEKIMREKIHSWKKELEIKEKYLSHKEENLIKRETQLNSEPNKYDGVEFSDQVKNPKNFSKMEGFKKGDKTLKNKEHNKKNKDKEYANDKDNKNSKHLHNIKDNYKKNRNKDHKVNSKRYRNEFKEMHKEFLGNKYRGLYEQKKREFEYSFKEKRSDTDKRKQTNQFSDGTNSCQNCKISKNKYAKKGEPNFLLINKKNDTIDGNWLDKLFKGRNDLRKKDYSGEWYFDRSSYRKRKRDKAKWYFDWMMDREILRYRRLYL